MHKIITDKTRTEFSYFEYGSKNKKTLLFLPGYADSALMYARLGRSLAGDFRMLALDLPMINQNQKYYTYRELEKYLSHFVHVLKLTNFTLGAFSSCGMAAIHYAHRHPKKTEELILLNSVPRFIMSKTVRKAFNVLKFLMLTRPFLYLYSRVNTTAWVRRWFRSPHISRYTRFRMRKFYFSIFGTAINLIGTSLVGEFVHLKMPKKTVFFNDDTIIPWERYQDFSNRLGGEVIVFSKGLHAGKKVYWEKLKSLWLKSPKIKYQKIKVEREK